MGIDSDSLRQKWRAVKRTVAFHNLVLFLVFVAIATLFWVIMALNDSAQDSCYVKVSVSNCPDSVTFISDIPERINVTVRDKGTNLWRNHYRHPTMNINFRDYASKGVLKYSRNDIQTSLKAIFGPTAQIIYVSLDSISLDYTTNKGKRVPIVIEENVEAASGSIIEGLPTAKPTNVLVYGEKSVIDTIMKVYTERIDLKDLSETRTVEVAVKRIRGARIMPSKINVTIPVEPLVKKQALITITPVNVPKGESLLLFPSKVPVEYFVAMSRLGDNDDPSIVLNVDYNSISANTGKLNVRIARYPERIKNLSLKSDSVEYTIVKN